MRHARLTLKSYTATSKNYPQNDSKHRQCSEGLPQCVVSNHAPHSLTKPKRYLLAKKTVCFLVLRRFVGVQQPHRAHPKRRLRESASAYCGDELLLLDHQVLGEPTLLDLTG